MSWAKFDDNYDSNPKIFAAGLHGKSLHESSIRYCCRQRTGGLIAKDALNLVATLAQLPTSQITRRRAAARLVELNLWEDQGAHWAVHDFNEYGPPKRFLSHEERGYDHAQSGPNPVPSRPVVSLKDLRDRATGRGVAAEGLSERLAGLQQRMEATGNTAWIPYVLAEKFGSCLFDQEVGRWLEQDSEAYKTQPLPPFQLPKLKSMDEIA